MRLGAGQSSATLEILHIVRRVTTLSQANIWSILNALIDSTEAALFRSQHLRRRYRKWVFTYITDRCLMPYYFSLSDTVTPVTFFAILSADRILQNLIDVLLIIFSISLCSALATATISRLMFSTTEETASRSNKTLP